MPESNYNSHSFGKDTRSGLQTVQDHVQPGPRPTRPNAPCSTHGLISPRALPEQRAGAQPSARPSVQGAPLGRLPRTCPWTCSPARCLPTTPERAPEHPGCWASNPLIKVRVSRDPVSQCTTFPRPQECVGDPIWGNDSKKEVCWGLRRDRLPYSSKKVTRRAFRSHPGHWLSFWPMSATTAPPKPGWRTQGKTKPSKSQQNRAGTPPHHT